MKQKDIAIIVAVAGFSVIVAFILANLVINTPENQEYNVQVLDSVSNEFSDPDPQFFNNDSIDPTQKVQIGDGANPQPFN